MSTPVGLNMVPQRFLDKTQWAELRAFALNDLIALTYLNAPYPDEDNSTDFFWGRDGTFDEAVRCYNIGRNLLDQCRRMLTERKLLATGARRPSGTREIVKPDEWVNLWPMFATNGATGPNHSFSDVEVVEATALQTPYEKILLDCINWLGVQTAAARKQKKAMLFHQAKLELGENLILSTFDAAYKASLGHSRGRPKK